MNKEEIEEILVRNNDWNADEEEVEISGVEFSRETMDVVIKELSTLIQESNREAVRGFAKWHNDRMSEGWIGMAISSFEVEEYLLSIGKEGDEK